MPEPTFSIVMPAFNTASMIGAAIGSALAQTCGDFELLVVDDGSTDGTRDIVKCCQADARVKLLTAGPRGGPGAARNAGIARARGMYVSMLDSDDLWLPTYLERAGETLDRDPSVGFVCAESWTLDDPPGLLRRPVVRLGRRTARVFEADELLRRLVRRNFVVNSTVTARRSMLVAAGGWNSSLRAAVDFDLWLRIAAAGYGAVFLPDPLAVYRVRRGSIQNEPRNELRANEALRLVYLAVAENWPVPDDVKSVAKSHIESIDRRIAVLTGKSPVRASLFSARRRLGPLIRAVLGQRHWYAEPPAELGATLKELDCPQIRRRLTHEPRSDR